MSTETPRADSAAWDTNDIPPNVVVYVGVARQLERELVEARAQLAECRKTVLHDAWQQCKVIESRLTASDDPYDDHLSQVATECADAIQKLAG